MQNQLNKLKLRCRLPSKISDEFNEIENVYIEHEVMEFFGQHKLITRAFLKNSIYKVGFILNDNFQVCMCCLDSFSFINRKHHCRSCGFLLCNSCTTQRFNVNLLREKNGSRLCKSCVQTLTRPASTYQVILNKTETDEFVPLKSGIKEIQKHEEAVCVTPKVLQNDVLNKIMKDGYWDNDVLTPETTHGYKILHEITISNTTTPVRKSVSKSRDISKALQINGIWEAEDNLTPITDENKQRLINQQQKSHISTKSALKSTNITNLKILKNQRSPLKVNFHENETYQYIQRLEI